MERTWRHPEIEAAWKQVQGPHPEPAYPINCCPGFGHGFADCLAASANGQPPVVPPWSFRGSMHEAPAALVPIAEWLARHRRKAKAAQASGMHAPVAGSLARFGCRAIAGLAGNNGYATIGTTGLVGGCGRFPVAAAASGTAGGNAA